MCTQTREGLREPDSSARFPEDGSFGRGRPFRHGSLRGRAYAGLHPELAGALAAWLSEGRVPGATVLKAGRVFLRGSLVVKFFPPASLLGRLREARALRSAERYFGCLPVPSPRPLVAAAAAPGGASLLVREFVPGRMLDQVWRREPPAMDALPGFLALMDRHDVLHGDLHPQNLLWDGMRWLLLDVDGVRHRLHLRRRLLESGWARLLLRLEGEEELRAIHARTQELLERPRPEREWSRIRRRARDLAVPDGRHPPP